MNDPLSIPCPKCRAQAGQPCRNYLGKRKQTCPVRTGKLQREAPPAPKPEDPGLFGAGGWGGPYGD